MERKMEYYHRYIWEFREIDIKRLMNKFPRKKEIINTNRLKEIKKKERKKIGIDR